MKSAVKWMVNNHVAANLLMMVFIFGGLVKGMTVKQEVFPEFALDKIQVSVSYPGAGPEEVEEGIILKIEDNLTGIDGIKEIKSVANEGFGTVTAEIRSGENADVILQDIKSEVDRITTFPEESEEPIITKLLNLTEVISVVVYGDISERALREQAEMIREELLTLPDITQVELSGVRPYEISIEIPEENLRRYNLTLDAVAQRLRKASLDLPGGNIKTDGGEILLRTKEKRYKGSEYETVTVVTRPDGTQVTLRDIADVRDTFEETDEYAQFDGQPAAMVKVFRVGDQKPVEISRQVRAYVERKKQTYPETIRIATWNDTSEIYKSRMDLLIKNAWIGLILVVIILGLFLEVRLALWVMLGIPISLLGTMFIIPFLNVSINIMSLFAFILALGILVDDAIIVGENIFEHRQMDKPYFQAALDGVMEVAVPVTFSILTTVAAFMPLVFVSGVVGKFMKAIPLVVISLLIVSLVESLFVLPAHLSVGKRRTKASGLLGTVDRIRIAFGIKVEAFIAGPYCRFLDFCLRNRYATLCVGVAVLIMSVGTIKSGLLQFNFMPEVDGDIINVSLKMPPGTPVTETEKVERHLLAAARQTIAEYDRHRPVDESILQHIYAVVGGTIVQGVPQGNATLAESNLSDMALFLQRSENRGIPVTEISDRWRDKVGELPGIDSLTFTTNLVQMGADIDIQMAHKDFSILNTVAERIKQELENYPGVRNIADTYTLGKREIKIRLRAEARTLGITEEDLARQIRGAFYGSEALRLQIGRNEIKVMVRYPEKDRKSLWDLESMRIRTPAGGEIPLQRAAYIQEGRGFSEINRTDRKRVINVTASVNSRIANSKEILEELDVTLLPDLKRDYPGLVFSQVGEEKERRESSESMKTGFLLALFAIYALLAIPFKSYSQPLLIMTSIPFGIVGAVIGHLIMGHSLSILSMFGLVALSGVVVNDALLLIDKINVDRRKGAGIHEAVMDAGRRRFRPILLTSLTTFFGLTPMILETSVQAQFLIPMAISLGFGIMFATGITLLLIPCMYMSLEDIKSLGRKMFMK